MKVAKTRHQGAAKRTGRSKGRVATVPTVAEARKRTRGRASLLDASGSGAVKSLAAAAHPDLHGPAEWRKTAARK